MIDLTEEQKLAVIREYRNAKMREWYNKNKKHRNDYMREWKKKQRERNHTREVSADE